MRYSQSAPAKQYAKAFLKVFGNDLKHSDNDLKHSDIDSVKSVIQFLKHHHNFMSLVSLLMSDNHDSNDYQGTIIQELFDHFRLPVSLKSLVRVLIHHNKLSIFASVLTDICCLFYIQNNILEVTISSAVPLDQKSLKEFEQFFEKLSEKKIITTVVHDPSLIAGVAMQSDLYRWEYSIVARLAALQQNMLLKE